MIRQSRVLMTLCIGILCCISVYADSWKTYTSKLNIQDLYIDQSILWGATDGGLFAFDLADSNFITWTNTQGLASNNIGAITGSLQGPIWLGMNDGTLQQYHPVEQTWLTILDFLEHPVTALYLKGDTLFVGLDIGLSAFIISRLEVKETYRRLGNKIQAELAVNDILIESENIWVATDEGIANSDLTNINLLNPESWTNFTIENGLPHPQVNTLIEYDEKIFAGTGEGVAVFEEGEWYTLNDGLSNSSVFEFTVQNNTLYMVSSSGAYYLTGSMWSQLGQSLSNAQNLISDGSSIWVGTARGLATVDNEGSGWTYYAPNGPGGNRISDMAIDLEGVLWCCSGSFAGKGFYRYDGVVWTNYDRSTVSGLPSDAVLNVAVGNDNSKWLGSWGGGLIYFGLDSLFRFYNAENGYLSGISSGSTYTVVSDLSIDSSGTVWILNRESSVNQPLVSVTKDSVWTYYGTNDGITSTFLTKLVVDAFNIKWIGTQDRGIFVFDDAGTPTDKGDDQFLGTLTTSDGLASNEIKALATDRLGNIWIGTPKGLFYFTNNELDQIYNPPSDNITALLVDGLNNIWVGTTSGVGMFSPITYNWTYYTKSNSDLISNDIVSLEINLKTGELYIGTNEGISVLETPFSEPLPNLENLHIYPNPFVLTEHQRLVIDNLSWHTSVHIFTSSGYLIRSFNEDEIYGKQIFWNGTNESGETVAGGIYLIVAHSEDGGINVAKLALIR